MRKIIEDHLRGVALHLTKKDLLPKFKNIEGKFVHLSHFEGSDEIKSEKTILYSFEALDRFGVKRLKVNYLKKKGCVLPKKHKTCKKRKLN